jgi:3'-phosphoadenosine 5'-phosphosulfate (PAPS) 3'-phosphatase
MSPELRALLDAAHRAARDASAAILAIYATEFAVRKKDDSSPVTEADERAERLIVAALAKAAPDIPVSAPRRKACRHHRRASGWSIRSMAPKSSSRATGSSRSISASSSATAPCSVSSTSQSRT